MFKKIVIWKWLIIYLQIKTARVYNENKNICLGFILKHFLLYDL